jgi:hypothetical protein
MKIILNTDSYCEEFESLFLQIYNNKFYLSDLINPNTKIKIKNNINIDSDYGMYLLKHLGYDNDYDKKIILQCQYITKINCLFNKYKNVLFIITFNNFNVNMYKFNKVDNDYKYAKSFIQDN